VDASHNGGSPVAPAKVTAVRPDGTVNVRVTYDGPPSHQHPLGHHRPEWLTGVLFRDTTDPAAAMRLGQYGAFWPIAAAGEELAAILYNQEMIMAAQDDINAATAAIQAVTADLTSAASNIQAEIAALKAQGVAVDTTALDAAIAPLQAAQAAVDALETPAAPAPAPAAPVSASDTGSAA
jgi:hypothetical protein